LPFAGRTFRRRRTKEIQSIILAQFEVFDVREKGVTPPGYRKNLK
jgi:hypothetical protein